MTLEHSFQLNLPGSPDHLFEPERVFALRGPFGELKRQGDQIEGVLLAEAPLLGEIRLPFQSRLVRSKDNQAHLEALPLEPPPAFWAELWGKGEARDHQLYYQLHLRIHAHLPESDKWGGRALRKMAEAAFERQISKTLRAFQG